MRARLKSLTSDEIPDLKRWRPPDPERFAVPLVLEVGPLGLRGRERFEVLAATPGWLQERHGPEGVVVGRGLLLVFGWDYERLRAFLAEQVERCSAASWPELARKVSRFADWEGEGDEVVPLR
ncbi:MAG: immunity 8 family protein [Anaeromyxobacter sp.]